MRRRTTRDTWQILVNYGEGWEHECTEFTRKDAIEQVKAYRDNAPGYAVKWRKRREPITKDDDAVRRDVFEAHRRRDPHCSCTDCVTEHAARLAAAEANESPEYQQYKREFPLNDPRD